MSRIIRFHRIGGPEVLQIDDVDLGMPGPGEVRIKVRAIGLNRAESMFRSGNYGAIPALPSRIGYEASGEIDAIGDGVVGFSLGDAVSTIPAFQMEQYGVYGDTTIVPAAAVTKHPPGLSWSEAASIWMQYLTAYGALVQIGQLAAGEAVIITAASSSVGLAAIQIANSLGAIPIATTRTSAKRDALLQAGAAHVIATDEQDLEAEVMRITGGSGARMAFDAVSGPGVEVLAGCLADYGTLVLYGRLSSEITPFPLLAIIYKNLTVRGYILSAVTDDAIKLDQARRFVVDGINAGNFKPLIDRIFPFEEIIDAHRYLEANQQVGKIVVTL